MSEGSAPAPVTLCVTGGIAAYKACLVLRGLMRAGLEVDVILTEAATRFVTPLTFEALARRPVRTGLWERGTPIAHVEQARATDLVIVAPATAHTIARFAGGFADDLVSATVLASTAPVLLAPAMETGMWENPLVQANVEALVATGRFSVAGPAAGPLASGAEGVGRMAEPEEIVARALLEVQRSRGRPLTGIRAVVTAGPTREHLDPVRYLTNPSTGKMGFAVASALYAAGADVTLIHGPTHVPPPSGPGVIPVVSAREMADAVLGRAGELDLYVGTAAIADFTPARVADDKIKKEEAATSLDLDRTTDVIASLVEELDRLDRRGGVVVAGFAVETRDLETYAREKLERKGLDLIAANDVTAPGRGFASDENELLLIEAGGSRRLGAATKEVLGRRLVDVLAEHLRRRGRLGTPEP